MNNGDIDLPALRCFVTLMNERSVTRAAEKLGLTQPGVSHTLARLRLRLGDPLLMRVPGGMMPTPRALAMYHTAQSILDGVQSLYAGTGSFQPDSDCSRFVVTVPEYFERLLAPPLLARLQKDAVGVSVEFRGPDPEAAQRWLETGEVDLRIGWVREPWPGLRFSKLPDDRLVCLVRADHPTVGRRLRAADFFELPHVRPAIAVKGNKGSDGPGSLTLEQYLGLPASTAASSRNRRATEGWEAHRSRRVKVVMLTQSFAAIPVIVAASNVIATIPERLAGPELSLLGLRLVEPPFKLPPLQGALYWHERTNADIRHRWFRNIVSSVAHAVVG